MKKILWLPILGVGLLAYWCRQHVCWHQWIQRVSGDRIFLECVTCGRETAGWEIDVCQRYRQP